MEEKINIQQSAHHRGFKKNPRDRINIEAGQCRNINVENGDIINICSIDGGAPIWITAIDEYNQQPDNQNLKLPKKLNRTINTNRFDSRELEQITQNRQGEIKNTNVSQIFDEQSKAGEIYTLEAKNKTSLIAIAPITDEAIEKGGGGKFEIEIKRATKNYNDYILPTPLGKIVEEIRIPRATAKAYCVQKGQFIQIIDVEGQQCSDFMAMRQDALEKNMERYIDSTVSRTMVRGAYPSPGLTNKFFDQDIQPLLEIKHDTVGRHDTFALACTARGYEERGFPGHINCSDNISNEFNPYGIKPRAAWPAINFFFNSWMNTDTNNLETDEGWSKPGDYVAMEALTDLVCVSTACPDDVDPINGWNPTDVHVRIYQKDTSLKYAVAYRTQPEENTKLTTHSPFHKRTSQKTSSFAVAADKWLATKYDETGTVEEYWTCKNHATLQDMSSLRKFDVMGPDAETLLQYCLSRNIAKLAENRGLYALMCDERGSVMDDGTLFRMEPNVFRWCCASDNSALHLREQAEKLKLRVWIKTQTSHLANLALQGPKSRDILKKAVFIQPTKPALENIKWFGFTIARLKDRNGPAFMLSRTGFTGELGYEIFCDSRQAIEIWDGIMEIGEPMGMKPMGMEALNILRIEAGLMSAGAEFTPEVDAFEAGLGFAIDLKKDDFIGAKALKRNSKAQRKKLVGVVMNGNDIPDHADAIYKEREQVGVITSATRSPEMECGIAMARIAVENAEVGNKLEVGRLDGNMKRIPCTITEIPFIDPQRKKARA